MRRVAILILGMHRSGTSAAAWLAGRLGAALPADGIGATEDNAKGYHESAGLVRADDQLLRACRSSWFDPRPLDWSRLPQDGLASRKARIREAIAAGWGEAPVMAIKDPRQCRFVPLVAEVLDGMDVEPRALLVLRPAAEVARSLARRDGTSPAYAHLLWLRHMIDAERATRGLKRAAVRYDALLADWKAAATQIAALVGNEPWRPDDVEAATIAAFLDPALRHHVEADESVESPLGDIVREVEAGLYALAAADAAAARARLDAAYARLDALPWLEGDVVHDELRHRRMPDLPEAPEEPPAPIPSARPAPPPAPDPSGDATAIRESGLFDADWYLARYPDVAGSGLDPVDHYVRVGAPLGYNPGPLFDTGYYARQMARRAGTA